MQIVDAGGGDGRSPRSVMAERGVVQRSVATAVHHRPQVVACRTQTAELLFHSGLPQVATVGDVAGVHAGIGQCGLPRSKFVHRRGMKQVIHAADVFLTQTFAGQVTLDELANDGFSNHVAALRRFGLLLTPATSRALASVPKRFSAA